MRVLMAFVCGYGELYEVFGNRDTELGPLFWLWAVLLFSAGSRVS